VASGFWLLASGFWLLASGFWHLASGYSLHSRYLFYLPDTPAVQGSPSRARPPRLDATTALCLSLRARKSHNSHNLRPPLLLAHHHPFTLNFYISSPRRKNPLAHQHPSPLTPFLPSSLQIRHALHPPNSLNLSSLFCSFHRHSTLQLCDSIHCQTINSLYDRSPRCVPIPIPHTFSASRPCVSASRSVAFNPTLMRSPTSAQHPRFEFSMHSG